MKKRKLLRNVSLVALSAVLVGGTAMAFTACGGGGNPDVLTIYIFCNDSDQAVNQSIADRAMEEFNRTHADELNGRTVRAEVENQVDQIEYFKQLSSRFSNNNASDIVYVSPKYVTTYASQGKVLDLTPYLTGKQAGMTASAVQNSSEIWPDALTLYAAYLEDGALSYTNAAEAVYDGTSQTWKDYQASENGTAVGIYGLPKDYSSFSMGYNRNFFKDALKEAYTTTLATTGRNVTSWKYVSAKAQAAVQHTGSGMSDAVRYATSGTYTNPYTGEEMEAKAGDPAPLINVGVPTTYKPFNFYKYPNFADAKKAGDPVALGVEAYTNGKGYTVTIPGFPNDDPMKVADTYQDKDAPYDTENAYITYTYAEYGALSWAISYYLTTFAWDKTGDPNNSTNGGKYLSGQQSYQNVYGGEQYESSEFGINGYLLPWLVSNDVTLISSDYTRVWNTTDEPETFGENDTVKQYVGKDTETVEKLNLDGTTRNAEVQYGMDSENFIETYGAFQEIGSTWNANCGTAGDAASGADRGNNTGWTYFTMGASLFYGAGTWDASTRNETNTDNFWFGQMPVPVSEKLALYSEVRNGYYESQTYSNAPGAKKTGSAVGDASSVTGDYAQREKVSDGLTIYDASAIAENQLKRQDKWGARMDSVGYAVNSAVLNYEGDQAWKKEAAFLVLEYLTINPESQVSLTYAGSQMPNFVNQCEEFLKYQDAGFENGAFKDMITPDGDAAGNDVWDAYYTIAEQMATAARGDSSQTVAQFMADKTVNGQPAKYNEDYATTVLSTFSGDQTSLLSFSMRVLNMVNFSRQDRDLNMRMEYGLNSATDQLMYTQDTAWMGELVETSIMSPTPFLAYYNKDALGQTAAEFLGTVATKPAQGTTQYRWWTPAVSLIINVREAQTDLNNGNLTATPDKMVHAGDGPIDR